MTYIVTCDQNIKVQLPGGVKCTGGSTLNCPESCPRRRFCSMTSSSFEVFSVEADDGYISSSRGLIRYSASEISSNFSSYNTLQTFPDFADDAFFDDDDDDEAPALEELKPERVYNQFSVRHRVFSNDPQVRMRIPLSRPLNVAMREIFTYWDTNAVFKSDTELKDDFIWLLVSSMDTVIYKGEIDMILKNPAYNRQQKFFHIFYDVVYRNNRPDGFYWCDDNSSSQPIVPRFTNRSEFIKYLMNEQGSGLRFYKSRKNEILSYLGIDDEQSLFYDITCDYERDHGQIILIDPDKSDAVKRFGTKEAFVQNMQRPTDLANMQAMISFLKQYSVNRHGVSLRPADIPLQIIDSVSDDRTIYDAAGLPKNSDSQLAYSLYLSLLKEYIKSFAPQSISVGQLRFSSDNYSQEIETYIDDYVKELLIYGDGAETNEAKRKKGKALFAINIYENKILSSYELKNEDSLKEKIAMFYQVSAGSGMNMSWYLGRFKNDNLFDFCTSIQNDKIVKDWFEEVLPRNSAQQIENAMNRYQGMYNSAKK